MINRVILVQHLLKDGKTIYDNMNENISDKQSIVFLRIAFIGILALLLFIVIFGIFSIVIDIVT